MINSIIRCIFATVFLFFAHLNYALAQISIPYTMGNDGHYLVDVQVNGQKSFHFIVDTAAQNTSLYPVAVKALGLKPLQHTKAYVQGANGMMKAELYHVKSIELGGKKMKNFNVAVLPTIDKPDNIGGILGFDFLDKYAVEFDPSNMVMRLHTNKRAIKKLKRKGAVVPLQRRYGGFLFFDIYVDDQPILAVLDTGARRNVINWAAANAIGIGAGGEGLLDDAPIIGATGKTIQTLKKTHLKSVKLGNQVWTDQMATIVDMDVFKLIGLSKIPAGVFGAKVFENKHFLIDFKNKELVFLQP